MANALPSWIQAGAAVAQVVLAAMLWWVTRTYVRLTRDLVLAQREQVDAGTVATRERRRAGLVRVRQLADFIARALRSLPEQVSGGGVDNAMRQTPMWSKDEAKELVRDAALLLPDTQNDARELAEDLEWITAIVTEVRSTRREQGFLYERVSSFEWQNRRSRALKDLSSIDVSAGQALHPGGD